MTAVMRYLVALGIEEAILVLRIVVVEAVDGACAGGDGAGVGAVVEIFKVFFSRCPCVGGVEEGRGEVEGHNQGQ